MVVKTNFSIPKHDHEGNMEKILSSVQPDKQLTALQMVLAPDLFNQLQEINHHGIIYWTNSNPPTPKSNQQRNMEQTFPSVQYSWKLSAQQMAWVPALFNPPQATNNLGRYLWTNQQHFKPASSFIRRVKSSESSARLSVRQPFNRMKMSKALAVKEIALAEEVNGKWKLPEKQQNLQSIALQSWAYHPQHLAITEQSTTALFPIAVAMVHTRYGRHDRLDVLKGVIHIWSQASCSIMSRRRSTMHSPGATGQEEHDARLSARAYTCLVQACLRTILLLVIGLRKWRKIRQSSTNLGGGSPLSHWANTYTVFSCYAVCSYMISRNKGDVGQDNTLRDSC
jgi:hypothetical protein